MISKNRIESKFNVKKIAAEPDLIRKWLIAQAVRIESLAVNHPGVQRTVMKFADELVDVSLAIGDAPNDVQHLIEGKARRMARKCGFSVSKGRPPYSPHNQGLFRVTNERGIIVAGRNYDQSAQEVIVLCRAV